MSVMQPQSDRRQTVWLPTALRTVAPSCTLFNSDSHNHPLLLILLNIKLQVALLFSYENTKVLGIQVNEKSFDLKEGI